ncbi:Hypothetical predicted protein [Cloeon dipterum]|uniref:SAP domain-containing protein n=3 Tax=Cloeon dipterum TaxID=197152 RepID=A0A8S1CTX6_9INSE|nr:Hypothetical predicted protein [Cloeon dipterum]
MPVSTAAAASDAAVLRPIIHPTTPPASAAPILLQQSPSSDPGSPESASASQADCPHCQEYGGAGPVYWRIQLDKDLLETILSIYPEWFKECNLDLLKMAESGQASEADSEGTPKSPPKAEVDESPLQKCMDKNKESLKVKLMLRRPINQLVAQGIMPPLKTPPAFHEVRQKLERAKTGDMLKAKIQQRPDRQELVRQHILEDVGHVDPSLAERQRMLKKARLQDSLNDQLSHRPGPLELIQKNILHTDETIERAVKEGQIAFRATCEGQLTKPQHPNRYITLEEDSSSEGGQSPPQSAPPSVPPAVLPPAALPLKPAAPTLLLSAGMCFEPARCKPVVVPVSVVQCPEAAASPSLTTSLSSLSPISSVASPKSASPSPALVAAPTVITVAPLSVASISAPPSLTAPTTAALMAAQRPSSKAEKELQKNRKKSKTKTQPKARTIKFHEYKGPPNAQKSLNSPTPVETSYELLLQQQQLFLQWQLEWQHKFPQLILPASKKKPSISGAETKFSNLIAVSTSALPQIQPATHSPIASPSQQQSSSNSMSNILPSPAPPTTPTLPPATPESIRAVSKLEDMKVNDLKAELKRRNLPVSGSKPQLIDRLRPYSDQIMFQSDKQPATPGSVSSICGISNPKSCGTLALGDESLSDLSSMDTPCSPATETPLLGLEASSPDNASRSPTSPHPSSPLSLIGGPVSNAPSTLLSPATNMDVDNDLEMASMDTTDAPSSPLSNPVSPASPFAAVLPKTVSEEIINQQQRKIEQLQRELQKSQQQNQQHKAKEQDNSSTKNQLQQHLQQKQQQKQLQQQMHKLQQLQTLRQQQLQQDNVAAATTVHQQQQPILPQALASSGHLQQQQQQLNVKASLAAFLLQQAQQISVGQPQHPFVLSITTTAPTAAPASTPVVNNNNVVINNNNNLVNNREQSEQEQKQHKINQINLLQKQRSNSVAAQPQSPQQQQRSASISSFRGSFDLQQSPAPLIEVAPRKVDSKSPPPPIYEEAAKLLKVHIKQEANASKQKHIKSQIVDDVLEILIKNGELPPSAAQVPVTPTTPGNFANHELAFKAGGVQETKPPPTPPPLPAVSLQDSFTLNLQSMISDLNVPDAKTLEKSDNTFVMSHLDLILGQTGNNPQPMSLPCNNFNQNQVPMVLATNPTVDLGLDLESMDFGQLEPIKLEGADLVDKSIEEPMEGLVSGGDLPMELDMSEWLESMLPSTSQPAPVSSRGHLGTHMPAAPTDMDTYDPLLSNSQDVFDLFNFEDADLKMSSVDMNNLIWDKADYTA